MRRKLSQDIKDFYNFLTSFFPKMLKVSHKFLFLVHSTAAPSNNVLTARRQRYREQVSSAAANLDAILV